MNVIDIPFLPFKIKILQNPFLAHLYIPIRTYPQNFISLTLIVSAVQSGHPLLYKVIEKKHRQRLVGYVVQDGKMIIIQEGTHVRKRTVWAQ